MQSILIASRDSQKGLEQALKLITDKKIGKFDTEILEFEKTMGIPDVRAFKSKIFLKPMGNEKAIVLKLSDGATPEAQNALLKILEEPPPSANLIIVAESEEIFLPTILSRCKVIKLEGKREASDVSAIEEGSLNDKFLIAQNLSKDRTEATQWLEDAIVFYKEKADKEGKIGNVGESKKIC